jgi:hypothetical protein
MCWRRTADDPRNPLDISVDCRGAVETGGDVFGGIGG